jgi:hypothetical protein
MWLSLEDSFAAMDEHTRSVEDTIDSFKATLEPIYKYVLDA